MNIKKIQYKGIAIHYKIIGKGLPVFLIHGFGEDGNIWQSQIDYLCENYLLIIPDIPGSGNSASLMGTDIKIDDYADCIKAIASEEQMEKFVIIGHSMGGYISLAYLEKYPNELIGLGLIHSTAFADDIQKIETRKKGIQFIYNNGSESFLKTSIPGLFFNTESNQKNIDTLLTKSANFSKEQLIQYYEAMIKRPDRSFLFKNTKVPILIIAGKYDIAITKQAILQQVKMPGLCHFHLLKESGHMGMLEESLHSNEILAKYLQSVSTLKKHNHK